MNNVTELFTVFSTVSNLRISPAGVYTLSYSNS